MWALVIVSSVVKVFDETMNSVSAGSRSRVGLDEVGAVDVGNEAERHGALAVMLERLVGHHRAEVGAADADVDDVANALAGVALPRAAAHAVGEVGHLVEHGVDLRARRSRRRRRSMSPRGARRATCRTARFSVMLIFSPRNMASMRARRPDSSASCSEQLERLVGDAVLRVVEVRAHRLGRHALAALGIIREERPQMQFPDLLVVGFEGLPGRACGERLGRPAVVLRVFLSIAIWFSGADRLPDVEGLARTAPSSHKRNPPRKALALSPAAATGRAVSFSFLTLPPPRTTSSGSRAGDQAATTSATCCRHFFLPSRSNPRMPDVVLVGAFLVRKMAQFHRLDDAVDDHGGAKAGSQTEEQHLAALVAPQRLHGGVVDDLDRTLEGGCEIEPDPARCEVMRFRNRPIAANRVPGSRWTPRRTSSPGELLDAGDHLSGESARSRVKLLSARSVPVARILTWVPPTSTTSTFIVRFHSPILQATRLESGALRCDHCHQVVPGLHERLRSFVLKLGGQGIEVDAGLGELRQHLFAVAAIRRQDRTEFRVIGEGLQRGLGHRVHGERRGERLDVQDVGGRWVLGSGAGPQQTLRAGAGVVRCAASAAS